MGKLAYWRIKQLLAFFAFLSRNRSTTKTDVGGDGEWGGGGGENVDFHFQKIQIYREPGQEGASCYRNI
jgi:hypothetical protein